MSCLKLAESGMEVAVTEKLPFLDSREEEEKLLYYSGSIYSSAIGQGGNLHQGLYGPLPLPGTSKILAIIYSFLIADPTYSDPRSEGETYALFVLFVPENLAHIFSNRKQISKVFEEFLDNISSIQQISLENMYEIKKKILGL